MTLYLPYIYPPTSLSCSDSKMRSNDYFGRILDHFGPLLTPGMRKQSYLSPLFLLLGRDPCSDMILRSCLQKGPTTAPANYVCEMGPFRQLSGFLFTKRSENAKIWVCRLQWMRGIWRMSKGKQSKQHMCVYVCVYIYIYAAHIYT